MSAEKRLSTRVVVRGVTVEESGSKGRWGRGLRKTEGEEEERLVE